MVDVAERLPKISVLVSVYRTPPEILRETIQAVLDQTFGDFELLLLDDCPTDPRADVIAEFAEPRVRYFRNERNLGIALSRNRLMDMARGEYWAILDHDDFCRKDRLQKEVEYLDAHPECGVVSSIVRLWPSDKPETATRAAEDGDIRAKLTHCCDVMHSATMLRASVMRGSGVYYERRYSPAEDYRLFFRLIEHTRFHCIQEPLLRYRIHEGNTTAASFGKMVRAAYAIQCEAKVRYPQLYKECERKFGMEKIGYHVPAYWRLYNLLRFGVWVK